MTEERIELTWEEYLKERENLQLVDIRGESNISYGMIPGACHIPQEELLERAESLGRGKRPLLYCAKGAFSLEKAQELRESGILAFSLKGGYMGWLLDKMRAEDAAGETDDGEEKRASRQRDVEVSIRKKFHKQLFTRFAKAVRDYELVRENDRIAVCISGGKDSMLMAKLFQELKRHNKFPFEVMFLVMDPGYNEANRRLLEQNAHLLGVPVTIFSTEIFDAVFHVEKSPCYLCARMRRGHLYSKAKELGCNKIALGHHYDDVIETILMGMLYGGQVQTMMPKLHSIHFEGMELIRPMYYIREEDIKRWRDYNELSFLQCACRFTETCDSCDKDGASASKRLEVKHLIAKMKKINPFVESNIFRSVENVNLDTVVGYKSRGVRHSFLESYDDGAGICGGGGGELV
ncbi:MAG: ATP-binding protein [Eubacteriales bacterium]|nr:ATP-binding protein [Eubacteriales bacterium]